MRRIMVSVSAIALMTGVAHAEVDTDVTEGTTPEITAEEAATAVEKAVDETADATGDALEATGEAISDTADAVYDALSEVEVADTTYVLPKPGTFSTNDILGAAIYGSEGDVAARVDDVWITAKGDVTAFLVNEGGFLGLGEDDVALRSGAVTFTTDENANLSGYVSLTEEQLETVAETRYDATVEYRDDATEYKGLSLEDDVLGKAVVDSKGEKVATVRDVLLSRTGAVTHLVLAQGGVLGFGGDLVATRFNGLTYEQGDSEGALVMKTSAKELMDMPEFRYQMSASVDR